MWFMLKLCPILSFIYLAFNYDNLDARMINFITYSFSQILEVFLVLGWVIVVWNTYGYTCMLDSACKDGLPDCYQCFILVWVNACVIFFIPLKLLFIFATYGYALHTKEYLELKKLDPDE